MLSYFAGMTDVFLHTPVLIFRPDIDTVDGLQSVEFSLAQDFVAQELNETFTMRLTPFFGTFEFSGSDDIDKLYDELNVTIIDMDSKYACLIMLRSCKCSTLSRPQCSYSWSMQCL